MCRRLGRCEALSGHSLDTLRASFQIGARVALRRAKRIGKRYSLSPSLMLSFADALFAYMDELVEVSREGYVAIKAQTELNEQMENERRRLLRLVLAGPRLPGRRSPSSPSARAGRCPTRSPSSPWRPTRSSCARSWTRTRSST